MAHIVVVGCIRDAKADVLLVFGQDHFSSFLYDNMPAFCLGVGQLSAWGDWGTRQGELPTCSPLRAAIAGFRSQHKQQNHAVQRLLSVVVQPQTDMETLLMVASFAPGGSSTRH